MSANKNNSDSVKPFYYLDTIPDAEKNPDFWNIITSPHFSNVANYLIINEVRKYSAENITDAACRVQLAKIQAYANLLDLPRALLNNKDEDPSYEDILPD